MKKKVIIWMSLIAVFISACTTLQETTVVVVSTKVAQTAATIMPNPPITDSEPKSIPTSTNAPTQPEIVVPIDTPQPAIVDEYCNYNAAMLAVSQIDELTKPAENTGNSGGTITEEKKQLILATINQKLTMLDQIVVPGCLQKSVDHLRSSFSYFIDVYTPTEGRTSTEIFDLLGLVSDENKLFEEEYARVKACIPTGCQ